MAPALVIPLPTQPHSSTLYLDWARAHDPAAEPVAEESTELLRTELGRAHEKPGQVLRELGWRAERLPAAHRPWFWDTVGHRLSSWQPRHAGRAYALARQAEQKLGLPVDEGHRVENALLFARAGALPAKEMGAHQRWLAASLSPERAHQEFVRFLTAWAGSPAGLAADLATRIRNSARSAGLGQAEEARVLGEVLRQARGKPVPDALLDAAAAVLADHPADDALSSALVDLFPSHNTDGAAWLRLLARSGAGDAMVAGRVTPEGGCGAWLGRFTYAYGYRKADGGGVSRQQLPRELLDLVTGLAPFIRAEGGPVQVHRTRHHYTGLDADLLDTCLAAGVAVEDPGLRVPLNFWGERSHRDLRSLAEDPVFGPRLEGTVHARLRRGTALTLLPGNAGINAEVHGRITRLLGELRGGGLAAAEEAVVELGSLLDRPTATALDGIEEALAELDLVGPLARALRAGLPEEFGWPALEDALAEFDDGTVTGVTGTWPVLTVFSRDRAVAVDHAGRRAAFAFRLPEEARSQSVHYVGGRFLVGWSTDDQLGLVSDAFWSDRPEDVFKPENPLGMVAYGGHIDGGLGFQFETADGTGRHDGERALRPGDREGISGHEQQLSDGKHCWSSAPFGNERHGGRDRGWTRFDPETGVRGEDRRLPDFPGAPPAEQGMAVHLDGISLAPMPPGAAPSPLGQDGSLVGCRVLYRTDYPSNAPERYTLESIDGRRADFRVTRQGQTPWGIVHMPEEGEYGVLAETDRVRCHSAEDGSLLWELPGFPDRSWLRAFKLRAAKGNNQRPDRLNSAGKFLAPPPAFWHFLTPRDPASSRALRAATHATARTLLEAARTATSDHELHAELVSALPQLKDRRIIEGALRAARRAAAALALREVLSRQVGIMRSGPAVTLRAEVSDTDLTAALRGLLTNPQGFRRHSAQPQPATQTAIAADGRHLRGETDDETRRLSPPAPPADWTTLLGGIDAVAWRAVTAPTPDTERAALTELLHTWSGQPFAEPGSSWRTGRATESALAASRAAGHPVAATTAAAPADRGRVTAPADPELRFIQPGAAPAPEGATDCETVGIARDDAARLVRLLELLAVKGPLPLSTEALTEFSRRTGARRALAALALGGLPRQAWTDDHRKMLRGAPYRATKEIESAYDSLFSKLGIAGRQEILAAGMPDDPADLWADGGVVAAAGRMAEVWIRLLGARPYVDEDLTAALENDLTLGADWAAALAGSGTQDATAARYVLAADTHGGVKLHRTNPDGSLGNWVYGKSVPHRALSSLLVWALTERPVGDPAVAGVPDLHARLRELPLSLGCHAFPGGAQEIARRFGPTRHPLHPSPGSPPQGGADEAVAYDDGLLIVGAPQGHVFVRPAGLADPGRLQRVTRVCQELALPDLLRRVRETAALYEDGLARMVDRAADSPVPAGGYEANPQLSVPELVTEVAAALGVGRDAAALHLQLLALPAPTDRNVRRWNSWTAARHKAAQAELAAAGVIETGKRPRAGRTAFLPGGWTEAAAPHLPLESAKPATLLASPDGRGGFDGPFIRLLPTVPLHELFARAWELAARP
ncbi:hypothetical protein ACFQ0X_16625 [Streptomyces rectiviolaceus]|uniref:DNA-binding protein n=1 Tax=Streptomyces rectiviolaceus TaxID=332591 RepID=A0ABP6MFL1_9ACTN